MNIFSKIIGAFRPSKAPATRLAPEVEEKTHTYQVTDDGLVPSAKSLQEFYEIQESRHQARELFRTMQYAEELAAEDNTPLDTDPRSGYVKLPEHGFQSGPVSGFVLDQGEIQVTGNQNRVRASSTGETWMAKNLTGIWDKSDKTFSLAFQPKPGPKLPASPQHKTEHETFQALQKSRAKDLIDAAEYWDSQARALDGTLKDINPDRGEVVAPGVSVKEVIPEAVMSEVFYTDTVAKSFQSFDLESTPGSTVVAGTSQNGGRPFGARLTTHRRPQSVEVVLERPETGTTEKVQWVIDDGILHYEKYKKG